MNFTQLFLILTILVVGAFGSSLTREGRQAVPRCPDICTTQFDPVCASNNRCIRVFRNSCQLGISNCNARPNERYQQIAGHYCNNFEDPGFSRCLRKQN